MARLLFSGREYSLYDFELESELEAAVIENKKALFGEKSVYIDIKRRIGKGNHKGIPDAFLIDFFDNRKPQLYIVENELAGHDTYSHITEQIMRFRASTASSVVQIRAKLIEAIEKDTSLTVEIERFLPGTIHRTIKELVVALTEREMKVVIVINDMTTDLNYTLNEFRVRPDTVLLQRYLCEGQIAYYYEPMREEVEETEQGRDITPAAADFDTVVCAAYEDGFKNAYEDTSAWWAIRLSQNAREKLKYLAIYQKAPIAHIAHYAEIERIEPYKDSGKYILFLKNKKVLKTPIPLKGTVHGGAPQSPRFTTIEKLHSARIVGDLWQ